jgi:hypothetical protein
LDLAWVARSARSLAGDGLNRVGDDPKACTAVASIRQRELGPVEKIEHLSSELSEVQARRFFMNPYIIWSIMQLMCSGARPSEIYSRLLKRSLAFSPPNRRKSQASRRKPTRTRTVFTRETGFGNTPGIYRLADFPTVERPDLML